MARAKLGSLITDLSGSIGSTTFQNSNAGTIIRNKPNFAGNFSSRRNAVRHINLSIHKAWSGFSVTDRTLWQTFANFINTKQKHSAYLNISGQALFYQLNFFRLTYSQSLLLIPVFSAERPPDIICDIRINMGFFGVHYSRSPVPADEFIILKVTPIIKTSLNNFQNKLKIIPYPSSSCSFESIMAYYTAIYGACPIITDTVAYSWSSANLLNGLFLPFRSAIVTL
jgi:hypothetical protein